MEGESEIGKKESCGRRRAQGERRSAAAAPARRGGAAAARRLSEQLRDPAVAVQPAREAAHREQRSAARAAAAPAAAGSARGRGGGRRGGTGSGRRRNSGGAGGPAARRGRWRDGDAGSGAVTIDARARRSASVVGSVSSATCGEQRNGVVGPIGGVNRRMSTTRLRDLGCYSQVSGAHIEMRAIPVVWAFGYPVSGLGRYILLFLLYLWHTRLYAGNQNLEAQLIQINATLQNMLDEKELYSTQPISYPEENVSVDTFKNVEPEIIIALDEKEENETKIEVISERPEEPQKESKEDQPLVPNELPILKEGVHVTLPKAIDAPFVDISKGEASCVMFDEHRRHWSTP
ncbi:hypothetical protein Scep_009664 [Stephania cephalantha]|uniref:Uncharacterized protein n=1 Tax=Stephania cephalantha TaxID=152367 RepID=A0AAP0JV11_9MAGN